jgi:protein SCO1/2
LPPALGAVPEFQLTDQHGQPFVPAALKGKVWVADFIFTRCPSLCPQITATMGMLQHRLSGLGGALQLVSFSVDPGYDTPERLLAYAKEHHAGPQWSFVTGRTDAIQKVVVQGFKETLTHEGKSETPDFLSIVHGQHFVLVDRTGQIRGYYDSQDREAVDRLVRDAGRLANAG